MWEKILAPGSLADTGVKYVGGNFTVGPNLQSASELRTVVGDFEAIVEASKKYTGRIEFSELQSVGGDMLAQNVDLPNCREVRGSAYLNGVDASSLETAGALYSGGVDRLDSLKTIRGGSLSGITADKVHRGENGGKSPIGQAAREAMEGSVGRNATFVTHGMTGIPNLESVNDGCIYLSNAWSFHGSDTIYAPKLRQVGAKFGEHDKIFGDSPSSVDSLNRAVKQNMERQVEVTPKDIVKAGKDVPESWIGKVKAFFENIMDKIKGNTQQK